MSTASQSRDAPALHQVPRARPRAEGVDLLRLPGVRAFILWRGFPYVFQAAFLLVFFGLIFAGWGLHTPPGVDQKLYAKTNLTTLVVWGLWWPAMVWLAVLFGRLWCMVCPMELVSNVTERVGRRLGLRPRRLPPWIVAGTIMALLYALIQFLVAGAEIRRIPAWTSLFLIGLLAIAVASSLLFRDRAFCRGFCPVGLLLSAYGRGGMIAVRPGSGQTCEACAEKDCVRAGNRYAGDGRSCPSLLNPPKLNSNRDCLVCGQCIKACRPDNMRLLLRPPFPAADAREASSSWPMTAFIMLVSGFVLWELTSEWPAAEHLFLAVPAWWNRRLASPLLAGYVKGIWAMVVVPLIVWSVLGLLARLLGSRDGLGVFWRRMALPAAVIIAAGHMCKGLAKFVSWAGFLPAALTDPNGTQTALSIASKAMPAPQALIPKTSVATVAVILILSSPFFALREARLANPGGSRLATNAALTVMTVISLMLVVGWALPPR